MAAAKNMKKLSLGRTGASSGHITNLKQSVLETFNIYRQPSGFVILSFLPWYNRHTVVCFRKSVQIIIYWKFLFGLFVVLVQFSYKSDLFWDFFALLQPLTLLMKQTRQAVHTIEQSILLRCDKNWVLLAAEILTLFSLTLLSINSELSMVSWKVNWRGRRTVQLTSSYNSHVLLKRSEHLLKNKTRRLTVKSLTFS